MNTLFTNPDNNPPHKKHNNTSCKGIVKFPEFNIKDTTAIMIPDIKSVGIISIFLNFLITMVNDEKQKAQPIAIIFPNKSPVLIPSFIIINIPNKATNIIEKVISDSFSFKNINARTAVIKGIKFNVYNVFAIEVLANLWMKERFAPIRKIPPITPAYPNFLIVDKFDNHFLYEIISATENINASEL